MFVRWKRRRLQRTGDDIDRRLYHDRRGNERVTAVPTKRNLAVGAYIRESGAEPMPEYCLDAVLVESQRIDGRPRQRFVAHLGTIREQDVTDPRQRVQFWRGVNIRLDEIGITDGDRDRIAATLANRVVPPTPDEIDVQRKKDAADERMFRAIRDGT